MPTALRLRRGTTAQHATFTGLAGEATVDTSKNTLVVHDGVTAGGIPMARGDTVGMRNRIINGDMRIDQRNNGAQVTVSTGGEIYHVDRWSYTGSSTGGAQAAQQTGDAPIGIANTSVNVFQINANTTVVGVDYCIRQRFELANVSDFAGKVITASFWYKSSRTGTHGARVIGTLATPATVGGVDQTLPFTVSAANVWEYKTLVFNTATASITSWGSTANNASALILDIGFRTSTVGQTAAVVGDFFRVTAVQLEQGSFATPFERRPIGLELALCQRYYVEVSVTPTSASQFLHTALPVAVRATPTIAVKSGSINGATFQSAPFGLVSIRQATASASASDALLSVSAEL